MAAGFWGNRNRAMSDKHMNLEQATQSTLAKAVSTFGVPVLLTVIGTLGGIVLSDMRSTLQQQGQELQNVKGDVREMKATLDTGLVWRINEIERRLSQVEQAQKTP